MTFARIRKSTDEMDAGFTLIELLVVMIIIGILAAIAVPIFLNQRKKAMDTAIKSDIKSVADAIEEWAVDNPKINIPPTTDVTTAGYAIPATVSKGNTVAVVVPAGAIAGQYCLKGSNPASNANGGGGGKFFWYASDAGGLKSGTASVAGPGGACT